MQVSSPKTKTNIVADNHCGDVLASANLEILDQLSRALSDFSDEIYTHKANAQTSSIGMHIRHILEFYQAFLKTVESDESIDICYDNRQRNMLLETSRESASQALKVIKKAFSQLSPSDRHLSLLVIVESSQPLVSMPTTLHRELYHVLDHMVHHMALIKLVAEKQSFVLDEGFGLARATQAHQENVK